VVEAGSMSTAAGEPAARVALLINNYDYARFVGEAVRSGLAQSPPYDEIIVVDDGSTDDSLAVLAPFAGDVRIVSQANTGQLGAVWRAVEESTSDYVHLLDSDDRVLPGAVDRIRAAVASSPVKAQFQLRAFSDESTLDSVFPTYPDGYDAAAMRTDNERLGFYACVPTSGSVFRRAFLRDLMEHDLDRRDNADGVPPLIAPYVGEVVSVNEPIVEYRVHAGSDSRWGSPTPALLDREMIRFRARWAEAERVLAGRGLSAPDVSGSAYLLERRMMTEALLGRRAPLRTALAHAERVLTSRLPARQRLVLAAWGAAMALSAPGARHGLVLSRRSASARGRLGRWISRATRARRGRTAPRPDGGAA
jgi:hypothetical protein